MVDVKELSKFIVTRYESEKKEIDNLRLQKLLYLCQLMYCHDKREPLYKDVIEAWTYGPVVPEVYYSLSHMLYRPISSSNSEFPSTINFTWEMRDTINEFLDRTLGMATKELVDFSQDIVWKKHWQDSSKEMPIEEIMEYSRKLR